MCDAFSERRDLMVAGLNSISGIRCRKPGGAFYLFPNIAGLCEKLGAIEAYKEMPTVDRQRSSPSTLVQMFLLWRYQVATMDRRSFGSYRLRRSTLPPNLDRYRARRSQDRPRTHSQGHD